MVSAERLLVRGGHVFDLELPFEISDVLVEDGAIARVGRGIEGAGARVIDATGMIVMPGLINAHTHSNQSIEKGLCDALPLDAWMVVASYGGAGAALPPGDLYLPTLVGAPGRNSAGPTPLPHCPRRGQPRVRDGHDPNNFADRGG